jgi:nucleoside phosphorylase
MELFSIAKVCFYYGVEWLSLKYISDYTNDTSGDEWLGSLNTLNSEFEAKILEVVERIL